MSDTCKGCGNTVVWDVRTDAGGDYEVCPRCNRRNDGLGMLQDRLGLRF